MSEPLDGTAEAVTDVIDVANPGGEVETDTQAQGDEQSGDDAAAAGDETEGEGDKPKPVRKSPQERIDEVTKARREAERAAEDAKRDAEYWRQQALRHAPQPKAQEPEDDGEPNPNDYEHGELDARFIREHATYAATKAFEARQAQAEVARQQRERLSAFDAAAKVVSEKHPDFHEVVGRNYERTAALCTDQMREALITSEDGPAVAYHLASNPDEARRIAALDPISQIRAIGRLEAKLSTPAAPTAKTATDAPTPTTQVRGAGGKFGVAPDTQDFAAFERLADAKP